MTGRVSFTSDEEKLLVKYIARYKPGLKGRAGNQLYIQLCEDTDNKWKWSRRHPWQSWRDRYYKNQVWYDGEIKKYQMKHGISDGEPVKQGGAKNKGVVAEKQEDKEEEEEQQGLDGIEDEDAEYAPIALGKRKRGPGDEEKRVKLDSVSVGLVLRAQQYLKRDYQGQYRQPSESMFVMGRGTTFKEGGELEKLNGEINSRARTASPPLDISNTLNPNVDSARASNQTVRQQTHADPQPVASTSKVQLSPRHQNFPNSTSSPRRRWHSNEEYFATPPASPSPTAPSDYARLRHRLPKLKEGPFGNRFSGRRGSSDGASDSSDEEDKGKVWPPVRQRGPPLNGEGSHRQDIAEIQSGLSAEQQANQALEGSTDQPASLPRTAHPLQTIHAQAQALFSNGGAGPDHTAEKLPSQPQTGPGTRGKTHRKLWTAADNPFVTHASDGGRDLNSEMRPREELVRNHTIGNSQEIQSNFGRRVDLRAEMAKRSVRSSSAVHSRSQSITTAVSLATSGARTSASRSPPLATHRLEHTRRRSSLISVSVAEEDRKHIEHLGVTRAVKMIAKNFGFRDEVVTRAWNHFENIALTEEFFRRCLKKTKSVQDEVIEEMERDGIFVEAPFQAIADEPHGRQEPEADSEASHQPKWEQYREPTSAPSTTGRSMSRKTKDKDFKIKPLPIGRAMSEYAPPYRTRAGQYMRLVKQGRVEEALSREKRRASGGSGIFPGLRSVSATQESPQSGGKRLGMEDDEVDRSVEEVGDEDTVKNALLREEEEEAFLSANAENALELRCIEQRTDVDAILLWTASRLAEFRANSGTSPSPSL
ncbi:hypothetical protein DXG03_008642 [Asterophora parasitica]|uniref:TERF2-interacting telomeric protein 1 Myb domain-containing protein n=1 Tax=Asterophora parasitica TaxID=117018 RepID=A0A9P7G7R8_9AGAR|nr:hypothetical protein DXG03_008642 [Asterophora parasitica]